MKQIFDWMREQVKEMKSAPKTENQWNYGWKTACGGFEHTINEAEAKWEADCCEQWDIQKDATFVPIHSIFYLVDEAKYWKFCPHCGKPIKISEVE